MNMLYNIQDCSTGEVANVESYATHLWPSEALNLVQQIGCDVDNADHVTLTLAGREQNCTTVLSFTASEGEAKVFLIKRVN